MAMTDEDYARMIAHKEQSRVGRRDYGRRNNSAVPKMYIKIREHEIAAEYLAPTYFEKAEDEGNELDLFEGDDEVDFEYREEKKLEDWTLYNGEMRLVPLELLPMLPNVVEDITIFGSGVVSSDDGGGYVIEDNDVEIVDSTGGIVMKKNSDPVIKSENCGGLRIYLSAIKEWKIEFGAGMLFVWIRTEMFWYKLGTPSVQYQPFYKPVIKVAQIAIEIISLLKEETRASRLSFVDIVKRFAEKKRRDKGKAVTSPEIFKMERFFVVHGQIILQQIREFPDSAIQRSAFSSGLETKMLEAHYIPLIISKKAVKKSYIRNTNPSASLRPDATKKKPMRATTTRLVAGIWKRFYDEAKEVKGEEEKGEDDNIIEKPGELEDEDTDSESEEITTITRKTFNENLKKSQGKRKSSTSSFKWVGKSSGKAPDGGLLYSEATLEEKVIKPGSVVQLNGNEEEISSQFVLVEYMWKDLEGSNMVHGRMMIKGTETVLGNASDPQELFLLEQCLSLSVDSIGGPIMAEKRVRPWGHQFRKKNYESDELFREKGSSSDSKFYFYQKVYIPEKGGFFDLPLNMGVGNGTCGACDLFALNKLQSEVTMLSEADGFIKETEKYMVNDYVYVDEFLFENSGEENGSDSVKGSRNIGLKPFVIGQILKIETKTERNGKKKEVPVRLILRRFFRPDDISKDLAYSSDLREVFYSEKKVSVEVKHIRGKCKVFNLKGDLELPLGEDSFFCRAKFDYKSKKMINNVPSDATFSEFSEEIKRNDVGEDFRLKTLDVFAGCGGLSEGLHQSGVSKTLWAIEYEHPAAEAFSLNHPQAKVFCENCNVVLRCMMEKAGELEDCLSSEEAVEQAKAIDEEKKSKLPLPGEVDFINGGPPCQGFSGMNRFNDRAWSRVQCEMILAHLSFADFYRPRYFLLENVRNFVSFNKGQTFRLTLASLLAMGYQVRFGVLQAGNYGVAQSRKRAFIWAAAPGELLPDWPKPVHVFSSSQVNVPLPNGGSYSAVGDGSSAPLRSVTVRDTIGDLPAVGNGADKGEIEYGEKPKSWFQKQIRGSETILRDHISKEMNEINVERCKRVPKETPGADWRSLPEITITLSDGKQVELIPWCLPNTADRHNQWKGLFGRLDWDGNFPTSVTDPQPMGKVGMCFHPNQDRIVTVRECARSQGFPDRFQFYGSVLAKHRQIGNAVPPPLAKALGTSLKAALDAKRSKI